MGKSTRSTWKIKEIAHGKECSTKELSLLGMKEEYVIACGGLK